MDRFTLAFREVIHREHFGNSALGLVDSMILEALSDKWRVVDVTAVRPGLPSVLLPGVPDLRYPRRSLEILSTEFHLNASVRMRIVSPGDWSRC